MEILGTREKGQPAPARFVYQALVVPNRDPARQWLVLLDDEITPTVVTSEEPSLVTWSSIWVKQPKAQIPLRHIARRTGLPAAVDAA